MHNPTDKDCRNCFVGLYEMLFLETKGSVEKYKRDEDGNVFAQRYPYEYCIEGRCCLRLSVLEMCKKVRWIMLASTDRKM